MPTPMTQDDFNRPTSQLTAASASLNTAMAGRVGSNAQFMRSAADSDSSIVGASRSQSFLPSELRAAKAIGSIVDQDHRSGLPPRDRDINPLQPDARTLAAIAGNPGHPLHGVTTFGLGHDEQTPGRIDDINAYHRARGREMRILERQLPDDGYINAKSDATDQKTQ